MAFAERSRPFDLGVKWTQTRNVSLRVAVEGSIVMDRFPNLCFANRLRSSFQLSVDMTERKSAFSRRKSPMFARVITRNMFVTSSINPVMIVTTGIFGFEKSLGGLPDRAGNADG